MQTYEIDIDAAAFDLDADAAANDVLDAYRAFLADLDLDARITLTNVVPTSDHAFSTNVFTVTFAVTSHDDIAAYADAIDLDPDDFVRVS